MFSRVHLEAYSDDIARIGLALMGVGLLCVMIWTFTMTKEKAKDMANRPLESDHPEKKN